MSPKNNILIVGSSGYLGRTITTKLAVENTVIPTHHSQPYFTHSVKYSFPEDKLDPIFSQNNIDILVFAAEIEKKQSNPALANADFFQNHFEQLIRSIPSVTRVVYISSDGIFDGKKGYYSESDRPQPITKYGKNLKICEEIIQVVCGNYCIIRPNYLYGHSLGQLDDRLQKTKESQEEQFYFDDMFKSPIHVNDAADLIAKLALSDYVGIVHLGGLRMSVYDFHQAAMNAMGISKSLTPTKMPVDANLLRDTSVDVSLCTKLTGFMPKSVKESFLKYAVVP